MPTLKVNNNGVWEKVSTLPAQINADTVDGMHAEEFAIVDHAHDEYSTTDHTHYYAGSPSVGGAATSANKLNTNAGSSIQPVYFSDGKPYATTYTLNKSVPSNAVFTDTTYSVATTSTAGLMSASDKSKLDSLSSGSGNALSAYPVGAIYMSTDSTSPASLFGGSWLRIKGRFLFGAGSNASNTSTTYGSLSSGTINRSAIGEMGGEVKHKLTTSEMPSHTHEYAGNGGFCFIYTNENGYTTTYEDVHLDTGYGYTESTGGGSSHNNMPPYFVVYMWRRINDNGTDNLEEVIEEEIIEEEIAEEVTP